MCYHVDYSYCESGHIDYNYEQNRHISHEIGGGILNLKVKNLIANRRATGTNPTLTNYIERVISMGVDIALNGADVHSPIDKVNVNLYYDLLLGFSGLTFR